MVVLVFSIPNFFTNKNSQGRKLSAKKIHSSDNSALGQFVLGIHFLVLFVLGQEIEFFFIEIFFLSENA